jgi:hypothetical protein
MSSADSVLPSWFGVTLISLLAGGVVIGLGVFFLRREGYDDTSEE